MRAAEPLGEDVPACGESRLFRTFTDLLVMVITCYCNYYWLLQVLNGHFLVLVLDLYKSQRRLDDEKWIQLAA